MEDSVSSWCWQLFAFRFAVSWKGSCFLLSANMQVHKLVCWLPDWGLSNSLYDLENIVVKATDFPAWLLSPLYRRPQHTAGSHCVSAVENFLLLPSLDSWAVAAAVSRWHAFFFVTVRQEAGHRVMLELESLNASSLVFHTFDQNQPQKQHKTGPKMSPACTTSRNSLQQEMIS